MPRTSTDRTTTWRLGALLVMLAAACTGVPNTVGQAELDASVLADGATPPPIDATLPPIDAAPPTPPAIDAALPADAQTVFPPTVDASPPPDAPPTPDASTVPYPTSIPFFEDATSAAGIDFTHSKYLSVYRLYLTSGQAWGDYDGDGWLDLYVTTAAGDNVLYRNDGDGTFSVSSLSSQVALSAAKSGGAIFVDYDNDGDKDLYVLAWGANTLFRNDGGTGFVDVTDTAGVAGVGVSMTASWGDFDGDGDLDLYVANNQPDNDVQELDEDEFYRNDGDGTFTDISSLLGNAGTGEGFAASFLDADDDGDLDIYLVNDRGDVGPDTTPLRRNVLWRNDGPSSEEGVYWTWTDVSIASGADARVLGMGVAVGDYDNDLRLDLAYTAANPLAGLYRNLGNMLFESVGAAAGVALANFGWGIAFADFDNDSWLDLYIAESAPPYEGGAEGNRLLLNSGQGAFFHDVSTAANTNTVKGPNRTIAIADYDRDGWLDVATGGLDLPYRLQRNTGIAGVSRDWIRFRLEGRPPVNRDAVGSRVTLVLSNGLTLMQEVKCGSALGAGHDLALHFGLGTGAVSSAQIRWPDGTVQTVLEPASNQELSIIYPTAD